MLDIEAIDGEVIAPEDEIPHTNAVNDGKSRKLPADDARLTLEMALDRATFGFFQEQSARARGLANSLGRQLEIADARVHRAEAEVAELSEAYVQTLEALATARSQLLAKELQLSAAVERIRDAERRANDAETRAMETVETIGRIVEATRIRLTRRIA